MKTIRIFSDITEDTLKSLTTELDGEPDGAELTLQVCSAGGFVFCAYGIIDYFERRKFHVTAEVFGFAASAAALITVSCERVRMAEFSALMLHGAYSDGYDKADPGIACANDIQLDIIRRRCPDFEASELERDRWYRPQESVARGFCDEIINNARDIQALCDAYLAKFSTEVTMEDQKKTPCAEAEETTKQEEVKAEDNVVSSDDLIEKIVERLDAIEHRIAVLEGEGKKADDIAEGDKSADYVIMAKRRALYAKLTAPAPVPVAAKVEAKRPVSSKIDLSAFLN